MCVRAHKNKLLIFWHKRANVEAVAKKLKDYGESTESLFTMKV